MDVITVSAKTLDEAITKALIELQTTSEHLHYDIIQKESSGFFGFIGGKPCVIRAKIMTEEEEKAAKKLAAEKEKAEKETAKAAEKAAAEKIAAEKAAAEKIAQEKAAVQEKVNAENSLIQKSSVALAEEKPEESGQERFSSEHQEKKRRENREGREGKKNKEGREYGRRERAEKRVIEQPKPVREEKPKQPVKADPEVVQKAAKEFLGQVFSAMGMNVDVETSLKLDEGEMQIMMNGEDMGLLIGKRGQTLDSLQYLVSLVVNRETEGYLRVKLDTENYRERRKETLEMLAKNISYKVKRTKHPVSLEPMNPYERRIIHSALQNDRYVVTKSEGEDPYRHVVILPKRESYGGSRGGRYGSRRDRFADRERRAERQERAADPVETVVETSVENQTEQE